jgi:hypothetical protein
MRIDGNTIQEIKTLLVASMTTVGDREARLIEAFGTEDTLLGGIDYSLPPNTFVTKLVRILADYGNDQSGQPAIITFLISTKSLFGLNKASQIDQIISKLYPKPLDSESDSQSGNFSGNAFDVFVSYNRKDKSEVLQIAEGLERRGIIAWVDEWDISPGQSWQQLIQKQISQIKSAAAFIGENGIGPWQNEEIEALLQQFRNRGCTVIPVLLQTAPSNPEMPLFLGNRRWVDFRQLDPNPLDLLIAGIKGESPRSLKNLQ